MSLVDVCFITHLNSENRVKLFVQTFESFIKNTNFDLIKSVTLVDDASPIPIISEIPNMTYIKNEKQSGVGFSKNFAVAQGDAKYIYLSDTDVFFTPRWLDKMLAVYKAEPTIGILAGGCHPYLQTNRKYLVNEPEFVGELHLKDAVSGWSWLLSRRLWNTCGKLHDHAVGSGQSEDWEYSQRIKSEGYVVGSLWPECISHCGITNTENLPVLGAELFPHLESVQYL